MEYEKRNVENVEPSRRLVESVARLSVLLPQEREGVERGAWPMPSVGALHTVTELVKAVLFPDFFDNRTPDPRLRSCYIGVNVDKVFTYLGRQLRSALLFAQEEDDEEAAMRRAKGLALAFIEGLPEMKRLLYTDVEAVYSNDPAVNSYGEVIYCYPVLQAMTHYRMAHLLLQLGVPVIPRIITEMAHSATGIDIHPGAQIGEYFSIDHGTGVVIGETSVIGHHVSLYQGVTLGAKSFTYDEHGHPVNLPRHPIIEDHVTIYSNASILGRITVGHDSVIGGNIWLTESVPPYSKIVQGQYNA